MSEDGGLAPATETFVAHRDLLFTVAYEMLGSAADAEDVLQETWLRWADVDLDAVRDRRAYLVKVTTRQALMLRFRLLDSTAQIVPGRRIVSFGSQHG
ncbi:sigma factor, partial [Streptosporangium sandarakinum]